jgi:aminoglycoside 6'-N-acetyltransferase I
MKPSEDIIIRPLGKEEPIPYHLLLLADPSRSLVYSYLTTSSIYVAVADNQVIGEYVLYPIDKKAAEVKNIAVEEQFQGQGVGKLLLAHASKTAKAKGFRSLTIGTANSSVGQIYLYQQQGFLITGVKVNYFLDNYPEPIYENGEQCKDQLILTKEL